MMRTPRIAVTVAVVLLALGVTACRDREPQERYARDLGGDDGVTLLPTAARFAGAADDSILTGRAEIIKAEDVELTASQGAAGPSDPVAAGDDSLAGTLGALGKAFLGNLLGAGGGGAGQSGASGAPSDQLSQGDIDAIRTMIGEFGTAFNEGRYTTAATYFVEDERPFFRALTATMEEMLASVEALGDVIDEKKPGSRTTLTSLLTGQDSAKSQGDAESIDVTATGPDTAVVRLPDGKTKNLERENGEWRIREGLPPGLSEEHVTDMIEPLVDRIDELFDKLAAGTISADEAFQEATEVIQQFKGMLK